MATTTRAVQQLHALYIRLRSTDGAWIAPPELRPRIAADAVKHGTNLHDVAVGILSKHFKVPFEPSGRHTTPSPNAEELNLRVSGALWRALSAAATGSRQNKAIEVLCAHYKLTVPAKPKRTRVRQRAA